jgi:peptide/nickel transport system permease protein
VAAWLARRLAASIGIVIAVVTLTFVVVHLAPGSPCRGDSDRPVDPGVTERCEERYCLTCPLPVQYARYVAAVARGDLGDSFRERRPVRAVLGDRIPATLLLVGAALAIDFLLGAALGVYQAIRRNRWADVVLSQTTLFLHSVPTFWLALGAVLVLAVWLGVFPTSGIRDPTLGPSTPWLVRAVDVLWHLALPATTLGLVAAAGTARYQRAALLDVLSQDYVRTARAKGLAERRVVLHHALRNALLPLITLLGLSLPFLLTGAVLIEYVFSWPGMGRLTAQAVAARDYPVVIAATMLAGIMVAVGNLVADLLYAVADPRIRLRES